MIVHLEIYDISDNLDWDGEDKLVATFEGSGIQAYHIARNWRDVGETIQVCIFRQSHDAAPLVCETFAWLEEVYGPSV